MNFPAYRQADNEQISQLKNWIIEVLFENCELKINNFFFCSISNIPRVCLRETQTNSCLNDANGKYCRGI